MIEYNGLVVSVAHGGDLREVVESSCRYFKQKDCYVVISATRTKNGSAYALNEFADNEGVKVEWIAKSYEYNLSEARMKLCNKKMAEEMMKKV